MIFPDGSAPLLVPAAPSRRLYPPPTDLASVMKLAARSILLMFILLIIQSTRLFSKTINVPKDFPTIQAAVSTAQNGDVIEVDDGLYLEDNIVIDKSIRVKARNIYGAVIYGTQLRSSSVFIIRAAASIEGFVIKNAANGITQRGSPDVEWTGHDLAFLNISHMAVDVNDLDKNRGRARLSNIIVDHSEIAFSTNDAYGIHISDCLVTNCEIAFNGCNHIYFQVERTVVYNCDQLTLGPGEGYAGNHKIDLGPDVRLLDPVVLRKAGRQRARLALFSFFLGGQSAFPNRSAHPLFQDWFSAMVLAEAHAGQDAYQDAEASFRDALDSGRAAKSDELVSRACFGLAQAAEKQAHLVRALEYYEDAAQAVYRIISNAPLRVYKEGYFMDKLVIYDALVSLLFKLHEQSPSRGYDIKALFYAELTKTGWFPENLWRLRHGGQTGRSSEFERREENIMAGISATQARLQRPGLSQNQIRALSFELEQTENELNNLATQIRRGEAVRTPSSSPVPFPAAFGRGLLHLGELAGRGTAVILFTVGAEDTHAFMATASGLRFAYLGKSRELNSLVANYQTFLEDGSNGDFKGAAGGRRLFHILLSPLFKTLDKSVTKLIIIPDGALCYLPFETLVSDAPLPAGTVAGATNRERFLVEDYEIAYAPSLSYLSNAAGRKNIGEPKMDLLAVANEEGRNLRGLVRNSPPPFPTLSYASKEVLEISSLFPPKRRMVLINSQAREEVFKNLPLSDFRIIHIAAHGFYDDDNWWRSAILFRPNPGSTDDGLLQPMEIYRLALDADLVVLSACRSGARKLARGEGILGLSGAFLGAGARSVVSSLWTINDKSTALLMADFYCCLSEGMTKAGALRTSKIRMLGTSYRHPRHWAAFVLAGDSGSTIPPTKPSS